MEDEDVKDIFTFAPKDIVEMLLLKLDPKNISSACRTSKRNRQICLSDQFISKYYAKWADEIGKEIRESLKRKDMATYKYMSIIIAKEWPSETKDDLVKIAARNRYLFLTKELLKDKDIDLYAHNYGVIASVAEKSQDPSLTRESNVLYRKILEMLVQYIDPSRDNSYLLQWAASKGYSNLLSVLLKDGRFDPTANNNSSIRWAISKLSDKMVALLLEDGRVDPSIAYEIAKEHQDKHLMNFIKEYLPKKDPLHKRMISSIKKKLA